MGVGVILFCCFVVLLVPLALFLVTFIYRQSCVLCGLPKPSVVVASGIMFVAWLTLGMAVGLLRAAVAFACAAADLPRAEGGIITFLLALPLDLVISAGIESGLMGARFGKGVELWYTQRLIQLTLIAGVGLVAGLVVLFQQLAG